MDFCGRHPSVVVWVPYNEAWGQYRAEEVADLAYHLGYKENYLTGQVIGLDGGWV